eukprot:PhF_6_TR13561/c0_g1_i1/m.21682
MKLIGGCCVVFGIGILVWLSTLSRPSTKGGEDDPTTTVFQDLALGKLPGNPTLVPPKGSLRCSTEQFFANGCVAPNSDTIRKAVVYSPPHLPVCTFVFASASSFPHADLIQQYFKTMCMTWGTKDTYIYTPTDLYNREIAPYKHRFRCPVTFVEGYDAVNAGAMWSHVQKVATTSYHHCSWYVNATLDMWLNLGRITREIQTLKGEAVTPNHYLSLPSPSHFAIFSKDINWAQPWIKKELSAYVVDHVGMRGGQEAADGNPCVLCYSVVDKARPPDIIALYRMVIRLKGECTTATSCRKVENFKIG